MSLSLLDNILLRSLSDPVLTAKGSELTFDEEDTNFVIIHDAIKELSETEISGIDAYSAGTEYSLGDFVTYNNNTWEFINITPQTGVTPGTDATVWAIASLGLFSHVQNTDQYLDFGGVNEVAVSNIVKLSGTQTITGQKTFSDDIYFTSGTKGLVWSDGSYIKTSGGFLDIFGNGISGIQLSTASDIVLYNAAGGTISIIPTLGIFLTPASGKKVTIAEGVNLDYATASTLIALDGSKNVVSLSTATYPSLTELSYVKGVSSALQGQIDGKQPLDSDLTSWASVTRASGFDTFVATPSSLNLKSLVTDETGSGVLVFGTSPEITTSITTASTTFSLINATATTVNFAGGASTALNIGNASGTNTILGATTFSQALTGSTSLTIASDTDATTILGRAKFGSPTTDVMFLSHFDNNTTTDYAVRQNAAGATSINGKSGQTLNLAINNSTRIQISSAAIDIANSVDFTFATSTGSKIGGATNQKFAFWNKTPIVQPTTGITGATRTGGGGTTVTDTDTFGGYTIGQLAAIIINTGLAA